MLPRPHDDLIRVGVRLLVAAGLAGLAFLLFIGRAEGQELRLQALPDPAVRMLLAPEGTTPEARLEQADRLLREERKTRLRAFQSAIVDTGFRAWRASSPPRLFRSSLRTARSFAELWRRPRAEDEALHLLELALQTGEVPDELRARYEHLKIRSARALAREKLSLARADLDAGRTRLARVRLVRALEIWPASAEAAELLAELPSETVLATNAPVPGYGPGSLADGPESLETELASALLLERDAEVARLAGRDARSHRLASALVLYLGRDPEQGVRAIEQLGRGSDAVADLAERWRRVPDFDVSASFDQERRLYRVRRWLGLLGGTRLADRGLELSVPGYRAWKYALAPLNLALSVPSRFVRGGYEPQGQDVRGAGERYLERLPEGRRAAEIRDFIADLPSASLAAEAALWDDGRFLLPRASRGYPTLLAKPVLLTRAVLESAALAGHPELAELRDRDDVLLEIRRHSLDPEALRGEPALDLLARLARGLRTGSLVSLGTPDPHDDLGAIADAVRAGSVLRVRGANGSPSALGFSEAILDGGETRERGVDVRRDGEQLTFARRLGSSPITCPFRTVCVDRARLLEGSVYARLEVDQLPSVGGYTRIGGAQLGFELDVDGPQASLVLPLSRWLGVHRWVPFAAQLGFGVDGVGIWPRPLEEPDLDDPSQRVE